MIRLMIGRDLKSLYIPPAAPPGASTSGDRRLPHRHLSRHTLSAWRCRQRRDPRACRPGRLGAHRARPRDLRHRSAARRRDPAEWRADRASHTPREAIDRGIYLVPEDRKRSGCLLDVSVAENISLPDLASYATRLLVRTARETENAERQKRAPQHQGADRSHRGRHALRRQPAEGRARQVAVDAAEGHDLRRADARHRRRRQAAKSTSMMRALADAGVAILMISSDMEEVIGVSDRIAVMHEGAISGFLDRDRIQRAQCPAARRRQAAELESTAMFKKDLGLLVLILVVGAVVALINPRFLLADQPLQHSQPGRPVRHLLDRRSLRHHHRRHRTVGRLA